MSHLVLDQPTAAHTAPVPYHRLARLGPRHRWWRPLAEVLVALGFFAAAHLALVLVLVVLVVVPATAPLLTAFEADPVDLRDPVTFVFLTLSLITLIPAVLVGVRVGGRRRFGTVLSVAGRLRWRLLGRALAITTVGYALAFGPWFLVEPGAAPTVDGRAVLMLGLTLLLIPAQAAAEEIAFRGLLAQAVGSWLRHPAFAILLPVPLFVLGHSYDAAGQAEVAAFAVCAGVLAWGTGGLEAPIALHVVNNVLLFALGAVGVVDVNSEQTTWTATLIAVALTVAVTTALLVDSWLRSRSQPPRSL